MIIMLGQGLLYKLHRDKQRMLLEAERRRAFLLLCGLVAAVATLVFLWILQ